MKRNLVILASSFSFLLFSQFSCDDLIPKKEKESSLASCSTEVTVRLSLNLDGCGMLFEKSDGSYLMPYIVFRCDTPPAPNVEEDVLAGINFKEGQVLRIGYEKIDTIFTACMAGPVVKVTCAEIVSEPEEGSF